MVTAAPVRRTQEERRASTQRALLDAAVACLIEDGYAGLTTTTVADRAGVSRGAQLHHYPTRAALVAAAVAHVFSGLTQDYQRGFAALGQERSPARAVALLWSIFLEPRHEAVLDLYAAARTDAELRESLLPVALRHRANVIALAEAYFPESAEDAHFRLTLDLLLHAMLGMAVSRCLHGDEGVDEDLPKLLETLATDAASASSPVGGPISRRTAAQTRTESPSPHHAAAMPGPRLAAAKPARLRAAKDRAR
jgi:AcrR family transcriptional regulator